MAHCANCGKEISDLATACPQCGHPTGHVQPGAAVAGATIPNYLVQSILVTIFCCLPLGIVSIVFSSQVNSKLAAGDIDGAREASANAKKWAWISLIAGLVSFGIWSVFALSGNNFNMGR